MNNKIRICFLCLMLVLSITACGNNTDMTKDTAKQEKVTHTESANVSQESFASEAKVSSENNPVSLDKVTYTDSAIGDYENGDSSSILMYYKLSLISSNINESKTERVDKFKLLLDTHDMEGVEEEYETEDVEPYISIRTFENNYVQGEVELTKAPKKAIIPGEILEYEFEATFKDKNANNVFKYIVFIFGEEKQDARFLVDLTSNYSELIKENEDKVQKEKEEREKNLEELVNKNLEEMEIEASKLPVALTSNAKETSVTNPGTLGETTRYNSMYGQVDMKLVEREPSEDEFKNSRYFDIIIDMSKLSNEEKDYLGRDLLGNSHVTTIQKGAESYSPSVGIGEFYDKNDKLLGKSILDVKLKDISYFKTSFYLNNNYISLKNIDWNALGISGNSLLEDTDPSLNKFNCENNFILTIYDYYLSTQDNGEKEILTFYSIPGKKM